MTMIVIPFMHLRYPSEMHGLRSVHVATFSQNNVKFEDHASWNVDIRMANGLSSRVIPSYILMFLAIVVINYGLGPGQNHPYVHHIGVL